MTDEERLKELNVQRQNIQARIDAYAAVQILENKQQNLKSITVGRQWGHKWFKVLTRRKLVPLNHENIKADIMERQEVNLYGNPPMELRLALAKVFRDFYGIKETQDDN